MSFLFCIFLSNTFYYVRASLLISSKLWLKGNMTSYELIHEYCTKTEFWEIQTKFY